ncbi:Tll0287-like domain-containing protein [Thiolapillus sp.]
MKTRFIVSALLATSIALPAMAADNQEMVMEARKVIKQFATQLKSELKAAMKEGGPVNAISVCNEKAPEITEQVSTSSGWTVARTSLKPRSTANVPLPWERKVMEEFEARKAAGADPKTLDYSDVVEENGKKVFRYMKAIPTAKVCLNCHGGEQVKPEVEMRLKSLYPSDRARGFKEGDIRGAFVLKKTF